MRTLARLLVAALFTTGLVVSGEGRPVFAPIVDPAFPVLPDFVGLATSDEQVALQALLAARAEVAAGVLAEDGLSARRDGILAFWQPQVVEKKRVMQALADERAAWHEIARREGEIESTWEQKVAEMQHDYDRRIAEERRKILPPLPRQRLSEAERRARRTTPSGACWACRR